MPFVRVKSLFGGSPGAVGVYKDQGNETWTKEGYTLVWGNPSWLLGKNGNEEIPAVILESAPGGDSSSPVTATWTKYKITAISSPDMLENGGGGVSVETPAILDPVDPGVPAKPENYVGTFAQTLTRTQANQAKDNLKILDVLKQNFRKERSVVSFVSDDGTLADYTNYYDIVDGGVPISLAIPTDFISDTPGDFSGYPTMTWAHIAEMAGMGCEILAHTKTHPNLTTGSPDLADEITGSINVLRAKGYPVLSFAYPYGAYNNEVEMTVAKSCQYACKVGHNTADLINRGLVERYRVKRVWLGGYTTSASRPDSDAYFTGLVDDLLTTGGHLCFTLHSYHPDHDQEQLETVIAYIQAAGIPIKNFTEACDYVANPISTVAAPNGNIEAGENGVIKAVAYDYKALEQYSRTFGSALSTFPYGKSIMFKLDSDGASNFPTTDGMLVTNRLWFENENNAVFGTGGSVWGDEKFSYQEWHDMTTNQVWKRHWYAEEWSPFEQVQACRVALVNTTWIDIEPQDFDQGLTMCFHGVSSDYTGESTTPGGSSTTRGTLKVYRAYSYLGTWAEFHNADTDQVWRARATSETTWGGWTIPLYFNAGAVNSDLLDVDPQDWPDGVTSIRHGASSPRTADFPAGVTRGFVRVERWASSYLSTRIFFYDSDSANVWTQYATSETTWSGTWVKLTP